MLNLNMKDPRTLAWLLLMAAIGMGGPAGIVFTPPPTTSMPSTETPKDQHTLTPPVVSDLGGALPGGAGVTTRQLAAMMEIQGGGQTIEIPATAPFTFDLSQTQVIGGSAASTTSNAGGYSGVPAYITTPATPAYTIPAGTVSITTAQYLASPGGTDINVIDQNMLYLATHLEEAGQYDYWKARVMIAQQQHGIPMDPYAGHGFVIALDPSLAQAYIDSIGGLSI